jgi:hypothetical protein
MKHFSKLLLPALLSAFVLFTACDDDDDDVDDIVSKTGLTLTAAQEVPPTTSTATGTFDVSFNKTSNVLNYTVNWSNLTGLPNGAHIHGPAARGVSTGFKHDFSAPLPKTISGTYSGSVVVDGISIKEDSLLMGFYYINIHTPLNPGGEIRGQIEF